MMRYRDFEVEAPEYQPMAYFSTDADEDPAAYLATIHGTYSSDNAEGAGNEG
jgi:DNA-directed RNA polymerase subunit beta'